MSRTNRRLLLLVAAEVILGAVVAGRRLARPAPPEPDSARLDPDTTAEIRTAAAACDDRADDWRKLGELYMAAGCFRESERCHRIACKLAPDDATLARQWAFALERLALLDEANAQYRRAAALRPEDAPACAYFVGRNLLRAEKPDEARAAFDEGRALDANRYELARLHLRAGQLAEAEALFQELVAARPNALQVQLLGYRLAAARGDARRAFARADDTRYATEKLLTPFDEEAARVVKVTQLLGSGRRWKDGRELLVRGQPAEAEVRLREADRLHPQPGFSDLLAEAAALRGRFPEAAALLAEYEARNGPSARIAARLGDVWAVADQPAKARADWLRATRLEAGADLKEVYQKLSRSVAEAGDKPLAEWYLARSHYYVGRDILQAGHPQKAADQFATAVKHDPGLAQAWFYLGEARRRDGQTGPAADAYRSCLRLNPDHGRALAALAAVEAAGGK